MCVLWCFVQPDCTAASWIPLSNGTETEFQCTLTEEEDLHLEMSQIGRTYCKEDCKILACFGASDKNHSKVFQTITQPLLRAV